MIIDAVKDYLPENVVSTIKATSKNKATDIVNTTHQESQKFHEWFRGFFKGEAADIDVFMSNTFPIRNMDIHMTGIEAIEAHDSSTIGETAEIRIADNVVILKDFNDKDIYADFDLGKTEYFATVPYQDMTQYLYSAEKFIAIVGTVRITVSTFTVLYPITIFNWCNVVGLLDYPLECKRNNVNLIGETVDDYVMTGAYKLALWRMGDFTDINIALLNPYISVVIGESTTTTTIDDSKMKTTKKNDKKKKKPTHIRYIKKIRLGDISEKCVKRGITRHAQLWYVTGHWRNYQSGKRIFIQGYWKGVLRETKSAEARIREMVYPKELPEKIE